MTEAIHETINLAMVHNNPLAEVLSYYAPTPKLTKDGRRFYMYAGYYRYMLAAGNNPRFLRARTPDELKVNKRFAWNNLIGLETHLESTLHMNIMGSPMTRQFLKNHKGNVVWEDFRGELSNAERRWLRVVQTVIRRVKAEL